LNERKHIQAKESEDNGKYEGGLKEGKLNG